MIWPVASQKPNNLGLFDSLGNVFCWTQNTAILVGGQWQDHETPTEGNIRVLLGSTFNPEYPTLSSTRGIHDISDRYPQFGFRVARTIKNPKELSNDVPRSPTSQLSNDEWGLVWFGTVDFGFTVLRIVVEPINKENPSTGYQIRRIDQDNSVAKLDKFSASDTELFFQGTESVGVVFRGRRSSGSKSYEGEYKTSGRPYALKLRGGNQANFEPPSEIWEATLESSETIVQLRVYNKGLASERILIDDLTHKAGGLKVDKSIVDGDLILRVPPLQGEWKGKVNEAGTKMTGYWSQNGQEERAVFRRK